MSNPFYEKINEYHKWLQEEAERQRQKKAGKQLQQDDPYSEANLDKMLEKWKDNARRENGWTK